MTTILVQILLKRTIRTCTKTGEENLDVETTLAMKSVKHS